MPKKQRTTIRALPPPERVQPIAKRPVTETVVIHTTRKKERNAGGSLVGKGNPVLPIIGGIAGGAATVFATSKLNAHPVAVAAGATVGGVALASAARTPWIKQAALGAAIGAGTLGGVQLVGNLMAPKVAVAAPPAKKRQADVDRDADAADGLVTRQELNDALAKMADGHKELQKQQTCDLMSAFRDEVRKIIAEGPNGPPPATPSPQSSLPPSKPAVTAQRFTYPFSRDADGDDYMRNAYGEDMRDATPDDYVASAYGDRRDAGPDDYVVSAYSQRDNAVFEERDAEGEEPRDAIDEEA